MAIEIIQIFPTFKGGSSAADKQIRLMFAHQSYQITCPACKEKHSVNQLIVAHPKYRKGAAVQKFKSYYCPKLGVEIKHTISTDPLQSVLSLVPTIYYEWATDPKGKVSTGCYVEDVFRSTGLMDKAEAVALKLKFENPHS